MCGLGKSLTRHSVPFSSIRRHAVVVSTCSDSVEFFERRVVGVEGVVQVCGEGLEATWLGLSWCGH